MAKGVRMVTVRILHPGMKRAKPLLHRADARKAFTPAGVTRIVEGYRATLEARFPETEWTMQRGSGGIFAGVSVVFKGSIKASRFVMVREDSMFEQRR